MVKKKKNQTSILDELDRISKESASEVIDTRWYVVEHTPAYNTGGYYDQDIPAHNVRVSGYFLTRKEALDWMNEHEADEGKMLKIGRQNKRRKVTIGWYDY